MRSITTQDGGSNTRRFLSRRTVLAGSAAALTTGLAGCAGLTGGSSNSGDTGNAGGSGPTEIEYWMYFGAQEKREMTKLVEDFNSKHDDIRVKAQSVPFGSFLDKLFTSVNSKNAPHVASYYGSYGRYLRPICHPVDQYLSQGTGDEYFDIAWSNLQVEDKTYALPIDVHGKALYTNDAVMEKAGLDPKREFKDWESFSQACSTIKSETDARPFSFLNWNAGQAAFRTYLIALTQAGGSVLEGKPGSFEVTYDDATGVETAEMMASITGDLGWDTPTFQSDSARVKDFIGDRLGMFIAGTWSTNNFENENGKIPDDLSFHFKKPFMFPGDGEDVAWAESNSLYFPKNPNHTEAEKRAAVKFAEYVTQNNYLWASAGGHLPAAKEVATSKKVKNTKLWKEFGTISTMYDMVKNKQVRYQPKTNIHLNSPKFWSPFIDLYLHNVEPKKAVTTSAETLRQALAQQR